jgi:histidine triad (HIT) family protein
MKSNNCTFCDPLVEQIQEIDRIGAVRIIYPRRPVITEHVILLPARHVASATGLNSAESNDVFAAVRHVKKVFNELSGKTAFNLLENDGVEAGQHVPHVHFHIFGRSSGEVVSPYEIMNKKLANDLNERELFTIVEKLRALSSTVRHAA